MTHPVDQSVSIIGLGKLGIPLAAAIGSRKIAVTGYDIDPSRGEMLAKAPLSTLDIAMEQGLDAALEKARPNTSIAQTIEEAIHASDISFVIVPTPSLPDGGFDASLVETTLREIGAAIKSGPPRPKPHLVVVVSTVSPGSTDTTLLPALKMATGGACGEAFSYCYAPALVALGSVLDGFLSPDFAFVGETDPEGADRLEVFLSRVLEQGTPIRRMSVQSAEIAKIGLNNFLTLKISFSNLIGQLCHATPGADARDALHAIGSDKRVGTRFLNAGISYGGPCLPRDTRALGRALSDANLDPAIPQAAAALNSTHCEWLANMIAPMPNETVCVFGLSYRAGSHITEESASIKLANALCSTGVKTVATDPNIANMDLSDLASEVVREADPMAASKAADILVLTAPLDRALLAKILAENPHIRVVDLIGSVIPEHTEGQKLVRFGSARQSEQ